MFNILAEIFEEIGIPYFRQGSLTDTDTIPDEFFTFWNIRTESQLFYDNENLSTDWDWAIYFYTKNPSNLYTTMENFINKAKEKNFFIDGMGNDIPSDIENLFGRYILIKYNDV